METKTFNDAVTAEALNPSVALVGSDKQIEWAKAVRAPQIAKPVRRLPLYRPLIANPRCCRLQG